MARLALAAAVLSLASGAWWIWSRGSGVRTTPGGAAIGHLPRRVAPSDLNLLLITLDTTRAGSDRGLRLDAERDAEPGSHGR